MFALFATAVACASTAEAGAVSPCTRKVPDTDEVVSVPCSERLQGDWGGLLTEAGGRSYRVEIALDASGSGTIAYPQLSCNGTLNYVMRQNEKYIFNEVIKEGKDKCTEGGQVELTVSTQDGAALDYRWSGFGAVVIGRVSGVLVAGVARGSNTSSRPSGADGDECFRYLPNRGTLVSMECQVYPGETN